MVIEMWQEFLDGLPLGSCARASCDQQKKSLGTWE